MNIAKTSLSNVITIYIPISSAEGHCFLTFSTILQAEDNLLWFNWYLCDCHWTQATWYHFCYLFHFFFSNCVYAIYMHSQSTFLSCTYKCIFACTIYDVCIIHGFPLVICIYILLIFFFGRGTSSCLSCSHNIKYQLFLSVCLKAIFRKTICLS